MQKKANKRKKQRNGESKATEKAMSKECRREYSRKQREAKAPHHKKKTLHVHNTQDEIK